MVKIGSARISENSTVHGVAGDQTGREVAEEKFYMHKLGWLAFKPKEKEHALALAQGMRDACNNDYIGYDQGSSGANDRLGVYKWVREGKRIASINVPTSADCSGLERGTILQATGVNLPNFNTESMPKVLEKSGLFEPPFKVESEDQLEEGMILCTCKKGHTATVTEAKPPSGSNKKTQVQNIKADQPDIDSAQFFEEKLAGSYTTTAQMSLRAGAGAGKAAIFKIPFGATVRCYGYYSNAGSTRWLCVTFAGLTGFLSIKYLKKE